MSQSHILTDNSGWTYCSRGFVLCSGTEILRKNNLWWCNYCSATDLHDGAKLRLYRQFCYSLCPNLWAPDFAAFVAFCGSFQTRHGGYNKIFIIFLFPSLAFPQISGDFFFFGFLLFTALVEIFQCPVIYSLSKCQFSCCCWFAFRYNA